MPTDNDNPRILQDGENNREERIDILRLERNQITATLKRFQNFINNFSEDKVANLELRLRSIESSMLKDFNDIQSQLEFLDNNELKLDNRDSFENMYFEVTGEAVSIIRQVYDKKSQGQPQTMNAAPPVSLQTNNNNHKSFPPIELIKFYGEYDKWSQFHDLFVTLIHNDQNIDKIRKFYYLLGSIKGEASKVLESIQITADNYEIAWNMLKERYENTNLTIKNHVKALFDLPTVSKDKCSLRNLVDEFQKRFRALKLLKEPVESWSTILIYLLTIKLDFKTATQWEEHVISKKLSKPDIIMLLDFLSDRCKLLETSDIGFKSDNRGHSGYNSAYNDRRGQNFKGEKQQHGKYQAYASHFKKAGNIECLFCKDKHFIYHCQKFIDLPVAERIEYIKKLKICLNCFRSNHSLSECIAQGCKVCSKKHNTLFHEDTNPNNKANVLETNSTSAQTTGLVVNHSTNKQTEILLSTAIISIQDKFKNWHQCRALLDSGSQSNFISKNFAEKLKISTSKIKIPVVGIGSALTPISQQICTTIKSCNEPYSKETNFLIIDRITENLPSKSFQKSILNLPTNVILADNNFSTATPVDILLGVNIFYDTLRPQQKRLGNDLPILQETAFGWVISGLLPLPQSENRIRCNFSQNAIEQQLERFWNIEEYSPRKFLTPDDIECEKIFVETVNRDITGHFSVSLPIRENPEPIGESAYAAIKRLKSVERKFDKNPEFKKQYQEFMSEYEKLGHMRKIDPKNVNIGNTGKNLFYLPHHGVINESSTTTALRVVFDGSCPSSTGVSLNNILLTGPTIQDELFSILIRFRQHNVVITADVAKMYRQVKISENQRDLQRIVWRTKPDDEISHYNLLTVTYGTAPASFLATRALQQTALENKEKYPETSAVILRDFYVDDLISGTNTIQEAITLKREISDLLGSYGFDLRKWVSNKNEVVTNECSGKTNDKYYVHDNEISKTLGLVWHAKLDILTYTVKNIESGKLITKRSILSCISSIFDPLGLVSPIVIRSKMLIQKLWQLKQGWDEPLPEYILTEWFNLVGELPTLDSIHIKRHAFSENVTRIEIHCFCDASQVAYGACIYARSIDNTNTCSTQLLCAKSRVAPLKTVSIPRLELCSAVLATNLCEKLQQSLNLQIQRIYFWTDSTIVLSWLSLSPSKLKIFVANRVADIQSRSDKTQWSHVPTNENPADLVSRGAKVEDLKNSDLWWSGPKWLKDLNTSSWPKGHEVPHDLPEIKNNNQIALMAVINNKLNLFTKFSTLFRLLRVTSYCLRFSHNCKPNAVKVYGNLTVNEMNTALTVLLKIAQSEMFNLNQDINKISVESNLRSLNPIFGPNGLLRVGGRIDKANLSYDNKHQIILAPKHPLTRLIILNKHHENLHSGILSLLASLREQFWIINGRRVIRSILKNCLTCIRVKPNLLIRKMGNLPLERVAQNRPFFVSGVDFAGPFYIKDGKLRNRAKIKAYLCIFICFTTKAVHLEAVGGLGTDEFLNALKRFVSRRGFCKTMFSDNGTNFIGANNELKAICNDIPKIVNDVAVSDYLLKNGITWKFIPPRSPHHGGLWEAGVKRAKYHIHRIIGKSLVTFEELSTFFAQVEAAINSAPITPLSSDPSDLSCLTPGHFLIGQPLLSIPQHDLTNLPENRLTQYQALQQMFQVFWKRWSRDYLTNLQQRSKWQTNTTDALKIDSLVLLMDDNLPPMYWRMGRILQLHPGDDNITRVVTVKTSTGELKRAVQKLCLLPITV